MLLLILANSCPGNHSVGNSLSVLPSNGGTTGTVVSVVCVTGYTLTPGNTTMFCVGNIWLNKPECLGEQIPDSRFLDETKVKVIGQNR